jgi:hypothetical protein
MELEQTHDRIEPSAQVEIDHVRMREPQGGQSPSGEGQHLRIEIQALGLEVLVEVQEMLAGRCVAAGRPVRRSHVSLVARVQVLLGLGLEDLLTAWSAELVDLAVVLRGVLGGQLVDVHAAHGIFRHALLQSPISSLQRTTRRTRRGNPPP